MAEIGKPQKRIRVIPLETRPDEAPEKRTSPEREAPKVPEKIPA